MTKSISVSPDGREYALPLPDDYQKDYERVEQVLGLFLFISVGTHKKAFVKKVNFSLQLFS